MTVSTEPQHHITHLNGRMLYNRAAGADYDYASAAYMPSVPAPVEVEAFFNLSPHARVVLDPEAPARPVMFMSGYNSGGPGRGHVVVARAMSDLTWPAFLAGVQTRYRDESAAFIKSLTRPVWDAIAESKKRVSMAQRMVAHA